MARWHVAPTKSDLWIARRVAHHASPPIETSAKLVTLAADERALIAVADTLWLLSRAQGDRRRQANHLLAVVAVSGLLPHLVKLLFSQERPDRRFAKGRRRRGIPTSGRACDAFPSGHAMNAGAIAAAASRFFPEHRPLIWTAGGLLAASRVALLAHWPSDVLIGLGSGMAIEEILWRLQRRAPAALSKSKAVSLRRATRRRNDISSMLRSRSRGVS